MSVENPMIPASVISRVAHYLVECCGISSWEEARPIALRAIRAVEAPGQSKLGWTRAARAYVRNLKHEAPK